MVLVLLTIVFGSLTNMLLHSQIFSVEFTRQGVVEETGWRISARLGEDLYRIDVTTLLPIVIDNNSYIEFREVESIDVATGNPILGDYILIGWQAGPGETLNGLDDNGDGRIDEGFVSRIDRNKKTPFGAYPALGQWKSVGQRRVTQLAGNIIGVRFSSTGSGISYSVDVGLVDSDGNVVQKTFTQRISFRAAPSG